MKQTTKTSRAAAQLETMYRAINKVFFNDELPNDSTIITIASSPKTYGHFVCSSKAWSINDKTGEHGAFEINISAGTLDRPIENVAATLVHEMVHEYCFINGIQDTSRQGAYHNKRFRDEAVKRGIMIDYDPRIGWSLTSPTEELIEFLIEYGFEDIRIGRNESGGYFIGGGNRTGNPGTGTATVPKKGNSHKLICPCCHTIVRYTTQKAPNIICGDCNKQMIESD